MALLSWGKGLLETIVSVNGSPTVGAWVAIDTPQQDSTKLTPTSGNEVTAQEEGGEIVDSRSSKATYILEFDLFVKKGVAKPFEDNDGLIAGEHAFRYTPEDPTTEGFLIDRSTVKVEERYSTAEGKMLHYIVRCLKPATGKTVKPYTANALVLDKTKLYFSASADSTGKTVTATSTGNVTATSSESWCTVTTSGKVTTVKVTANSGSDIRLATVTITADGMTSTVDVMQII